jgi:uncharacterized membrane protein YfcA
MNDSTTTTDIQNLIPDQHRKILEVVPKGVLRSTAHGGILLGGLCGALGCLFVPDWLIPIVFAILLIIQRIWVWRSDKAFDARMADLGRSGLAWNDGDEISE